MTATGYQTIADAIAADIASGTLRPGARLPPQREFAYARGIAVSTAARVYAELTRRGLVTGEVGRGTYVRTPQAQPPGESVPGLVNLESVFPMLPDQGARMAASFAAILTESAFDTAMLPVGPRGTGHARAVAARFLARGGWMPDPARVLFTGNGRQALAAAMAALAAPGDRIGVECFSYPVVKSIAARIGVTLVPIALDDQGARPDAIVQAHREHGLKALYLQPALHNPLGLTMGVQRRADIVQVLDEHGLIAIEDGVYSFLAGEIPLIARCPEQIVLVDSLSKRLAPGTTLGFAIAPERLTDRLAAGIRAGGWNAQGFPFAAAVRCMDDGTAAAIAADKIQDARQRQAMAAAAFEGLAVKGDPRSYHLWLELPEPWRADTFCAAAARLGIALAPASAFAIHPGHAPNAVRVALASPPLDVLRQALLSLARLARSDGDSMIE